MIVSRFVTACAIIAALLAVPPGASGGVKESLISDIDALARIDEPNDEGVALAESIKSAVEKDPVAAYALIAERLKNKSMAVKNISICVWAIEFTRNPAAVDLIIDIAAKATDKNLLMNSMQSLAYIGDKRGAEYMLSRCDKEAGADTRYSILWFLSGMKYVPALTRSDELLKKGPDLYWQRYFFFGRMGDGCVPYLLTRINDSDIVVRANAIGILGQWLIAPEALKPLSERFWKEDSEEIQVQILNCLELLNYDIDDVVKFSGEVMSRSRGDRVKKFAGETIKGRSGMEKGIAGYRLTKRVNKKIFNEEYDKLYRSSGKEGDFQALDISSSIDDEPGLKALREKILSRGSDESFYDYEKINKIIIINRYLDRIKK
jgi:hypothetical protein